MSTTRRSCECQFIETGSDWDEVAYSIVLVETLILVRSLLGKSGSREQARGEDGSELHSEEVEGLAWKY